jgi:septal ring factor EnvC (AmiA/AmiB activator)
MDFKPFEPPPTDHHQLAMGHSSEHGVTAKALVEGVNIYFRHLFSLADGKKADDADRIAELEEGLATAQRRNDELDAHVKGLLTSYDTLAQQISHIESAASDTAFKADALERRLNDRDSAPVKTA